MKHLLSPTKLLKACQAIEKPAALGAFLFLVIGCWMGLMNAPADYQQGEMVRLMYIHVPTAWFSLMLYAIMGMCCGLFFITNQQVFYILAGALAPTGLVLTFLCLATGSIWGYPTWGAWWVWDARLTSYLLLCILYLGFVSHFCVAGTSLRQQRLLALFTVFGLINLPIIKFSVDWWFTLHQPASIMRMGFITIAWAILRPLLVMLAAFAIIIVYLTVLRIQYLLFYLRWMAHTTREKEQHSPYIITIT